MKIFAEIFESFKYNVYLCTQLMINRDTEKSDLRFKYSDIDVITIKCFSYQVFHSIRFKVNIVGPLRWAIFRLPSKFLTYLRDTSLTSHIRKSDLHLLPPYQFQRSILGQSSDKPQMMIAYTSRCHQASVFRQLLMHYIRERSNPIDISIMKVALTFSRQ